MVAKPLAFYKCNQFWQVIPSLADTRAPAAFIDRDGAINEDRGYVGHITDFAYLAGAIHGLRQIRGLGYRLVVVTNQAGIARGLYTEEDFQILTHYMITSLRDEGVTLDGIYHCPHHPAAVIDKYRLQCQCRKPAPGLLYQAREDLGLDLARSILIGDKLTDIGAGRAAGLWRCFLVRSGHHLKTQDIEQADQCFEDLGAAATWLSHHWPILSIQGDS